MRMLRITAIVCVAAFASAQTSTIKVDVPLVTFDVSVLDSSGRPVTSLTREDFTVYEDGQKQTIQHFSTVDAPYSTMLLFDASGSTRDEWPFLTGAMFRFVSGMRPQDRVAIAEFNDGVKTTLDWSFARQVPLSVPIQGSSGATNFYAALNWLLSKFTGVTGRKGAIVFTDGGIGAPLKTVRVGTSEVRRVVDSADDPAFQAAMSAVRNSSIIFNFVVVDSDLNPGNDFSPLRIYQMQQMRSRIEQLAEVSGGRAVFPANPQDLGESYRKIAAELGTSYSFGYISSSPADGRYRRIEVRTNVNGFRVQQSREGFTSR